MGLNFMDRDSALLPESQRTPREVAGVRELSSMQVLVLCQIYLLRKQLPANIALKLLYIEMKGINVSLQTVLIKVRFGTSRLRAGVESFLNGRSIRILAPWN